MSADATIDAFEDHPKLARAMTHQLERALERNKGHGGVSLSISQGGKPLFEGAIGHTDATHLRSMKVSTPFDIASITKTFTATMTLKLVEQRRLELDTPLRELLPRAMVDGFDEKITVRQLLSHTSGLPDYWADRHFLQAFDKNTQRRWAPAELLSYTKSKGRVAKPGAKFHYSDTNYVLLGLILERQLGQPLEQIFAKNFFEPLGMTDTFFSHGRSRAVDPAQAHRFEKRDDVFGRPHQSADWAGGGLVSSNRDLQKFFTALSAGRLFDSPKTMKKLLEHAVPTGDEDVSYGLGVFEVDLGKRGALWGHDGHGNAFAYYWPEKDVLFTGTLNQTENDWWPMVEKAISTLS
ncbi:MAG: beta-lactamase family protein [Archangiaceae bacterium]|nr:beta-lactamase family protein [Archangiaceae bacterium]